MLLYRHFWRQTFISPETTVATCSIFFMYFFVGSTQVLFYFHSLSSLLLVVKYTMYCISVFSLLPARCFAKTVLCKCLNFSCFPTLLHSFFHLFCNENVTWNFQYLPRLMIVWFIHYTWVPWKLILKTISLANGVQLISSY